MHFQPFRWDSCTWARDYTPDILHLCHKYQDKDQHTCFSDKHDSEGNLCSTHILVDNQCKDLPDILVNMYRFHCRNVHWVHKVIMHKGQ